MYPVINIFGLELQSYSIIAAIGFIITAVTAVSISKYRNIPADKSLMATLCSAFGIIIGGHLLFAITNLKYIVKEISDADFTFSEILPYISGMVFYGGLFGAIASVFIYTSVNKELVRKDLFDVFAVAVPLFHTFGRIGCFFAGCCYGVESNFGITSYLNTSATHYGVSRYPVQLFEALANLLIFILLIYFYKRNKFKGSLIFIYLSVYAVCRFILEYFRGDKIRGSIFGFSTSQLISLLIIAFLLICLAVKLIKKRTKPET